jgi:hypothetical protein
MRGENVHLDVDIRDGLRPCAVRQIADRLSKFLESTGEELGRRKPTLLCALGPPTTSSSLEQDQQTFWKLLSQLSDQDSASWPAMVPADPDDPRWSFCFGGRQLFVFALSPHYRRRRSRAIATTLTVCFQSSQVFADISGSTPEGRQAKAQVRARLAAYDDAPLIGALGDGQSSTVNKWEQYFPDDDGTNNTIRCPMADST